MMQIRTNLQYPHSAIRRDGDDPILLAVRDSQKPSPFSGWTPQSRAKKRKAGRIAASTRMAAKFAARQFCQAHE